MATKKAKSQPGSDIVVTLTVELIGVGILTLLAGVNKGLGSVVVVVMVGFLLAWLLINTTDLQKWIGKA
jgi:ABC-type antimicrobial peptide transport system permease subunit